MQEDGEPYNEQEEKPKKSEESFEDSIAEVDSNDLKLHNLPLEEVLPPYLPAIMGCRSVSEFQCLNKLVISSVLHTFKILIFNVSVFDALQNRRRHIWCGLQSTR